MWNSMYIFHPLKILWTVIQNYPYANLKNKGGGGGGDTLNQWEIKDSQEPWPNVNAPFVQDFGRMG